jgi:DNA-binding NarL/FixJ family response regulator
LRDNENGKRTHTADVNPLLGSTGGQLNDTWNATLYKRTVRREVSSIVLKLTPRQRQLVELLLDAADNKMIAKTLGIQRHAVNFLFHRIYKANGIIGGHQRVKLAAMAYREKRKVNGT